MARTSGDSIRISRPAPGLGEGAAEMGREFGFLVGAEEFSDVPAAAAVVQRTPLDAELLMFDALQPHPGRREPPFPLQAGRAHAPEPQFEIAEPEVLVSLGGAEIGAKREIEQGDVEPEKADDRPCPHEIERQAEQRAGDERGGHQHAKSLGVQRAMRRQSRVEDRCFQIARRLVHAPPHCFALGDSKARKYKSSMAQRKSPSSAKPLRGSAKALAAARARAETVFERLAAALPEPRTELEYANPFTLLVAVVLSAQATDVGVNRATPGLFALADTPARMAALPEAAIRDEIKTIGLFNTKAKNVLKLSQILVAQYGGAVPREREALESLPGVGRKTANVVLNVAFGEATIAVDTHIFRVGNRTGLAPGKNPLQVELKLLKRVPEEFRLHAHHWLILHGRYTCKARKPECWRCVCAEW